MTLEEMNIWLPCIVSIITLIVNLGYYIFIQPRQGFKYEKRMNLAKISEEMFTYLSELVSLEEFSGVPTQIRNFSLKIHLCFKTGTADQAIADSLEKIYQMAKNRKSLTDVQDIKNWNEEFRMEVRNLRRQLGGYCGGL